MMERISIYVDNSNIFKGFQKYSIKADYEKLKNIITIGRKLNKIYLYEGVIYPISPEKKNWYENLTKKSGYVIKVSFDKIALNDVVEKKIDIQIAIDMVSHAYEDNYDRAILVSGDGDFVPLVKKIKELKKNIELWSFKYSLANTLKEEFGKENIHYFDDILTELSI